MREMVERYVPDDAEVLIGGFAFSDPTAFAHELIRQRRRGLYVLKTSGGVLVDQLIGAGCVARALTCHIWNSVGPVAAHCFRRSLEKGIPNRIELDEMSFGAYTSALFAGAAGLPFMPTTPVQGTGHFEQRTFYQQKFAVVESPFDGAPVCVVPPLRPPLGVFHVQRVDEFGNAQMMGPRGEQREAMNACERVIVIAEELVSTEVVRERPELTIIPGFRVEAIVVEPWAAHPSDAYGYYLRDLDHHALYGEMSATEEGFQQYLDEWVVGTRNHAEFVEKLGAEARASLMERPQWW
jgi:glutaconate CoA-transferase subunit A